MPVKTAAQNLNHHRNHTPPYSDTNYYLRPKKLWPHQGTNLCAALSDEERVGLITTMELQEDQTKKHTVTKIGTRSTQADCSDEEDRKKPLSLGINVPQARSTSEHTKFGERSEGERERGGGLGEAPPLPLENPILLNSERERDWYWDTDWWVLFDQIFNLVFLFDFFWTSIRFAWSVFGSCHW